MLNENKQIQEPPPVSSLALFWGLYFVTLLAASLCLIQLGVSVPSSQLSDWARFCPNTRIWFVVVWAAFAGIPPFVFFFAKLALFLTLACAGALAWLGLLLLGVFFGWYVYFTAVRFLLVTQVAWPRLTGCSVFFFTTLAALVLFLLLGFFFFTDVACLFNWLLC